MLPSTRRGEYFIKINEHLLEESKLDNLQRILLELLVKVIGDNFFIDDYESHFNNLYAKEDLSERLSFIYEHRKFLINILGNNPKILLKDWTSSDNIKAFPLKRESVKVIEGKLEKQPSDFHHFNPENVGHNERSVFSIINDPLWDKAKWKGFGFFIDNQGLVIFIGFENGSAGQDIFNEWIERFGQKDQEEMIRITIIRGVDKNNPHWYRVHIGPNLYSKGFPKSNLFVITARLHEMNARSPENLNNLIAALKYYKKYRLCPAQISNDLKPRPYAISIQKTEIIVKQAWELTWQDPCRIVMKKTDQPFIPDGVENPEVLEIIRKSNSN